MATKKVKMLCNLGTADQQKYGLKETPQEGDVISVNEKQYLGLVEILKCATPVDKDKEVKEVKEEEPRQSFKAPPPRK